MHTGPHQSQDSLFLISSNGVPRHCTTSVNRGDTAHQPASHKRRVSLTAVECLLTVIAHRNVCDDLLKHRLAFRELLVLALRGLQLGAEFLRTPRSSPRSRQDGRHIVVIAHLDLAPREELGILAALAAHIAGSRYWR